MIVRASATSLEHDPELRPILVSILVVDPEKCDCEDHENQPQVLARQSWSTQRPLSSSFLGFILRIFKVLPKRNYYGASG